MNYIITILSLLNATCLFSQNKTVVSVYNRSTHLSKVFTNDTIIDIAPNDSVLITINKAKYLNEYRIIYNKPLDDKKPWEQYFLYVFDDKDIKREIIDTGGSEINFKLSPDEEKYSRLFYKNKEKYNLDSLVIENKNSLVGSEILYIKYCLRNEPVNRIDSLYSLLDNRIRKTKVGKLVEKYIETKPETIIVGNKIRDFTLPDTKDKMIRLCSVKSEFILLDFWFTTCVPCIQKFASLSEIYKSTNRAKFEIIGITIDKKVMKSHWLDLISRRELNWINLMDSDENLVMGKFGINQFPTAILLNGKKKIIKINPTDEEIIAIVNAN